MFDRGFLKQQELDADYEGMADNLRRHYIKQLEEKIATAREAGLTSGVRIIENEIGACGQDGQSLLEHFEANP